MTRPSTALPAPTLPTVRAVVSKKQPSHRSVRVVSVRLEESMIERLDALVERTGRTRGFYLRLAIGAMLPASEDAYWHQVAAHFEDAVMARLPEEPGPDQSKENK